MEKILNLTQHPASKEQKESGVFEPEDKERVKEILTFSEIPAKLMLEIKAISLMMIAKREGATTVMIGGAPFFMSALESALINEDIHVLYAFSKRESIETTLPSGEVVKKSMFKHVGFVEV